MGSISTRAEFRLTHAEKQALEYAAHKQQKTMTEILKELLVPLVEDHAKDAARPRHE